MNEHFDECSQFSDDYEEMVQSLGASRPDQRPSDHVVHYRSSVPTCVHEEIARRHGAPVVYARHLASDRDATRREISQFLHSARSKRTLSDKPYISVQEDLHSQGNVALLLWVPDSPISVV